jgi:hypothetical protein
MRQSLSSLPRSPLLCAAHRCHRPPRSPRRRALLGTAAAHRAIIIFSATTPPRQVAQPSCSPVTELHSSTMHKPPPQHQGQPPSSPPMWVSSPCRCRDGSTAKALDSPPATTMRPPHHRQQHSGQVWRLYNLLEFPTDAAHLSDLRVSAINHLSELVLPWVSPSSDPLSSPTPKIGSPCRHGPVDVLPTPLTAGKLEPIGPPPPWVPSPALAWAASSGTGWPST